jgi:F0F1-type ATP synthase assembly protein I
MKINPNVKLVTIVGLMAAGTWIGNHKFPNEPFFMIVGLAIGLIVAVIALGIAWL